VSDGEFDGEPAASSTKVKGPLRSGHQAAAVGRASSWQEGLSCKDKAGKFRFRVKASNGQVITTGEAF
jgi:hypothetical protein